MRKNIFLFNLILIMLITLNCNMAYAEPNESTEQNEEIENEPYKTLEELKRELKEERRQIDQQRLEEIRKKESNLVGQNKSLGTTPRRITDLVGSLCDLTSGSGDKGTPVVYIQGYFDNYAND